MSENDFATLDGFTAEELRQIRVNSEHLRVLQGLYGKVQEHGISKDIVMAIEAMTGDGLNENYPVQAFTVLPSELNKEIALESLIGSIIKATFKGVFNIFKFIAKLLAFILTSIGRFIGWLFGSGKKESRERVEAHYDAIVATTPTPGQPKVLKAEQVNEVFNPKTGVNRNLMISALLNMKLADGDNLEESSKIQTNENQLSIEKFFEKDIDAIEESYWDWLDKVTWLKSHRTVPDTLEDLGKMIHGVAFQEFIQKKDTISIAAQQGPLKWAGFAILQQLDDPKEISFGGRISSLISETKRIKKQKEKWWASEINKLKEIVAVLEKMANDKLADPEKISAFFSGAVQKIIEREADPEVDLFEKGVPSLKINSLENELKEEEKKLAAVEEKLESHAQSTVDDLTKKISEIKDKIVKLYYPNGGPLKDNEERSFQHLSDALQKDLISSIDTLKEGYGLYATLRTGFLRFIMERKAGERESLAILDKLVALSKKIVIKDFRVVPPQS